MTLSVVYVPDTGHVVAALAVTGAQGPDEVATLVGPALPMRVAIGDGETAVLALRAGRLAAFTADDEPGVFADPLAFGVEQVVGTDQTVVPKPALLGLPVLTTTLLLDDNGLTVSVPNADDTQDTSVLVLISDGEDTLVVPSAIAQGKTSVTVPASVDSGTHGVLVLVAGWAGRLEPVTKS